MKKILTALCVVVVTVLSAFTAHADGTGLYIRVMEEVTGRFDEASDEVKNAFTKAGWKILSAHDSGRPAGCKYRARVFVVLPPNYADKMISSSAQSWVAIPLRAALYENEKGRNISIVNPVTLNRFVAPDADMEDFSGQILKDFAGVVQNSVKGKKVWTEHGPTWETDQTFGIGGGRVNDNVVNIYTARHKSDKLYANMIEGVREVLKKSERGWKIIYTLDMRDKGFYIFGITKPEIEAMATEISGKKRQTAANTCPGIDHSLAFPIEIVANATDKNRMAVQTLRVLFRMKLYFADAGEMAFLTHLNKPGQIEDDIVFSSYPCYPPVCTDF
jgi:uncharacterized protein (DUF302 family)